MQYFRSQTQCSNKYKHRDCSRFSTKSSNCQVTQRRTICQSPICKFKRIVGGLFPCFCFSTENLRRTTRNLLPFCYKLMFFSCEQMWADNLIMEMLMMDVQTKQDCRMHNNTSSTDRVCQFEGDMRW